MHPDVLPGGFRWGFFLHIFSKQRKFLRYEKIKIDESAFIPDMAVEALVRELRLNNVLNQFGFG